MLTGRAIARAILGHFLVEAVLEETFMRPFLMINTNSRNTETEGNDKVQADSNNQNVIYDQTEIDEDREQSREQRAVWRVYFRK